MLLFIIIPIVVLLKSKSKWGVLLFISISFICIIIFSSDFYAGTNDALVDINDTINLIDHLFNDFTNCGFLPQRYDDLNDELCTPVCRYDESYILWNNTNFPIESGYYVRDHLNLASRR